MSLCTRVACPRRKNGRKTAAHAQSACVGLSGDARSERTTVLGSRVQQKERIPHEAQSRVQHTIPVFKLPYVAHSLKIPPDIPCPTERCLITNRRGSLVTRSPTTSSASRDGDGRRAVQPVSSLSQSADTFPLSRSIRQHAATDHRACPRCRRRPIRSLYRSASSLATSRDVTPGVLTRGAAPTTSPLQMTSAGRYGFGAYTQSLSRCRANHRSA